MNLERIYRFFDTPAHDLAEFKAFVRFIIEKFWNEFNTSRMDKLTQWFVEHPWKQLPNAVENSSYKAEIPLPQLPENTRLVLKSVSGVANETHGLHIDFTSEGFTVSGTPQLDKFREEGRALQTEFTIVAQFDFEGGSEYGKQEQLNKAFRLIINPDPRKLWKNLPVDWEKMDEPKYQNADEASDFQAVEDASDGSPMKHMVVASKRGRSHAHEGKPRDDAYRMNYCAENGWYVMAVSDGAGSASYSREGSRLACETAVQFCWDKLAEAETLNHIEAQIAAYHQSESENISKVGEVLYRLLCYAAFHACKAIQDEAKKHQRDPRTYAATLLLSITKRFSFGWFVATFWVGDGAIALYRRDVHEVKLMGEPDEGEYGGQTRFVTMPEIFQDSKSCYKRLRFTLVDDFTALFLMSDGVSDAKFETTNNLKNPQKWDELWENLESQGVGLTAGDATTKDRLLAWLDFWSQGNYDDRTIAVLCGKEYHLTVPIPSSTTEEEEQGSEDTPIEDHTTSDTPDSKEFPSPEEEKKKSTTDVEADDSIVSEQLDEEESVKDTAEDAETSLEVTIVSETERTAEQKAPTLCDEEAKNSSDAQC